MKIIGEERLADYAFEAEGGERLGELIMGGGRIELILNNVLLALQVCLGIWQFMKLTLVRALIQGVVGWLMRPLGLSPTYYRLQQCDGRVFKRANCFVLQADIPSQRTGIEADEADRLDTIRVWFLGRRFLLERREQNMLFINGKMCYYITPTIWEELLTFGEALLYGIPGPAGAAGAVAAVDACAYTASTATVDACADTASTATVDACADTAAGAVAAVDACAFTASIATVDACADTVSTAAVDACADTASAAAVNACADTASTAAVDACADTTSAAAVDACADTASTATVDTCADTAAGAVAAVDACAYTASTANVDACADTTSAAAAARVACASSLSSTVFVKGYRRYWEEVMKGGVMPFELFVKGYRRCWEGVTTGGVMTFEEVVEGIVLHNQHVSVCFTDHWFLPINLPVSEEQFFHFFNLAGLFLHAKVHWLIPTSLSFLTSALMEFSPTLRVWFYTLINMWFCYIMQFKPFTSN